MKGHQKYITTTHGLSGHFAIMVWFNPALGGFSEPYDTGLGRYPSKAEAVLEGVAWAKMEGLELRP